MYWRNTDSVYITDIYVRRWYLEIEKGGGVGVNERDEEIAWLKWNPACTLLPAPHWAGRRTYTYLGTKGRPSLSFENRAVLTHTTIAVRHTAYNRIFRVPKIVLHLFWTRVFESALARVFSLQALQSICNAESLELQLNSIQVWSITEARSWFYL